jgi:hypothetical protein
MKTTIRSMGFLATSFVLGGSAFAQEQPATQPPPPAQVQPAPQVQPTPPAQAQPAQAESEQDMQVQPIPPQGAPSPQQAAPPPGQEAAPPPAGWVYTYPTGQWVYTTDYGWVWVPAGTSTTAIEGVPYSYMYTPASGWTWYVSPWGWGPYHYGLWVRHAWRPVGWHGGWVAHPRVTVRLGGGAHWRGRR